jgi:hypothetical protein
VSADGIRKAVMSSRRATPALARSGPASAATAEDRAARRVWTVLVCVVLAALAGCASASSQQAAGHASASSSSGLLGSYPSFLPRNTLNYHSDTVLVGTVKRPALTNQGDGVEVRTAHWSVLVTVTGPEVPGEGLPYQAPTTTCTWTVTMTRATGEVPISVADFSSIDAFNNVYLPALVAGQPVPPRVLRPGASVSFELRAVMPTGEGLMRWAPDGRNIVAKWDFVIEND